MSEVDEEAEKTKNQRPEGPPLRKVRLVELHDILAAHRKWVESEEKDGKRADLAGANLQRAYLRRARLQGANLGGAKGLIASQVKKAKNWKLAFYSDDFLKKLGLPPDHNEKVKKKLAELEKEKKAKDPKR